MADGHSFTSLTLARRAKRGRVGTAGDELPGSSGVIGAVEDQGAPAASTPSTPVSAADLEFLSTIAGVSSVVQERGAFGTDARTAAEVGAAEPEAPASKLSHVPGVAFASLAHLSGSRGMDELPAGREYKDKDGTFSELERRDGKAAQADRAARRDVHAVKVVTRLVRGIAFRPGSDAKARIKSAELARMLGDVHRAATAVAVAAAPLDAHRGWVQAMCSEAMADLVAARNENDSFGEPLDIDEAVRVIAEIFKESQTNETISEAIADLRDAGYVEATAPAVADDRVRASTALAAWDLFDSVTHPRLGVGAFRYMYDHQPEEIVTMLCKEAVRIARAMNVRATSLDVRTMHLQGSIRRVAALLGSEYVNRTRQIMNWIGEDESEDEYKRRRAEARESLKTLVLPQVVELARRSFIAIEQIAPQIVEDSRNSPSTATAQRENAN